VNKVRDTVIGEDARLYNPFVITLSMSPIRLVYPIFYRGVSSAVNLTIIVKSRSINGYVKEEEYHPIHSPCLTVLSSISAGVVDGGFRNLCFQTLNNKPWEETVLLKKFHCIADYHPCGAYYDWNNKIIWDSWVSFF
jgi:hypothetical protein